MYKRWHLLIQQWVQKIYLLSYLFILRDRGEGMANERDGTIDVRDKCWPTASRTHHDCAPSLQPRDVPGPGIKPLTFCIVGWCPINWATLIKARPRCGRRVGQIWTPVYFTKCYQNITLSIHLCISYGCFHSTMAEIHCVKLQQSSLCLHILKYSLGDLLQEKPYCPSPEN